MWLSEIDYFSQKIIDKVHQLFNQKTNYITISFNKAI